MTLKTSVGRIGRRTLMRYRVLTGQFRVLPEFIIIGAQRAGTTSLYSYISQHPGVVPAFRKEVHFFDVHFARGSVWYRAHFETYLYRRYLRRMLRHPVVTGEASPYYLFHPHVPRRVYELLPRVKLIVLLRNPVDRACSHYFQQVSKGREALSLIDALRTEDERVRADLERLRTDETFYSFNHRHYSYLARGVYIDQFEQWMKFFARDQMLILKSEDLDRDPAAVMRGVFTFLELPPWSLSEYPRHHLSSYPPPDAATRAYLLDYFRPHNERLYDFLGVNFGWDQ